MIKTNRMKDILEIDRVSKAVLGHLFDCHTLCDEKWRSPKLNARLKKKEEGYTPKTKTYMMTISHTNRVMTEIGISNSGAEKYWRRVYEELDILWAPRLQLFFSLKTSRDPIVRNTKRQR